MDGGLTLALSVLGLSGLVLVVAGVMYWMLLAVLARYGSPPS